MVLPEDLPFGTGPSGKRPRACQARAGGRCDPNGVHHWGCLGGGTDQPVYSAYCRAKDAGELDRNHSGFFRPESAFELYVPGLLILSIIMIIFSASAAIVREAENRTLERLLYPGSQLLNSWGEYPWFRYSWPFSLCIRFTHSHCSGLHTAPRYPGLHPAYFTTDGLFHGEFQPPGGSHVSLGKGGGDHWYFSPLPAYVLHRGCLPHKRW